MSGCSLPKVPFTAGATGPTPTAPTVAVPAIPPVPRCWTFPADAASVGQARRAVVDALPEGCGERMRDDVRLICSELVTNAVSHGSVGEDRVEVVAWAAEGYWWIAVGDGGDGVPRARVAAPGEIGGRGLALVGMLAAVWGVVARPVRGKAVVAGVALTA
jgi:anti-sigma regulatory factor (Ser/Thr protein kinase)